MNIEAEIKQRSFKDVYHKVYVNLVYTSGWLEIRQAAVFKKYGLTLPQYNILRILRGQHPNPATVNLLIERMLDKTSNASRIVDKLVAKGLVTRCQCPTDRRTVDILITDSGLATLKQIDAAEGTRNASLQNLTETEAEDLSRLLDKIRN